MSKTCCIYISESDSKNVDFSKFENVLLFPDAGKTYDEIMKFSRIENSTVVVCSPIICTNYKFDELYVYRNGSLKLLGESIYGASLDIAIKKLHQKIKSMLSFYIIEEIRNKLKDDNVSAVEYINSLADSMEKAYLIKYLEKEIENEKTS